MKYRSTIAIALLLALACGAIAADDKDPVKEKLLSAKMAYDGEMRLYRKSAEEWFDKREDTARKAGDKKTIDQIKKERGEFDDDGVLPKTAPVAVAQKSVQAKKILEAAYAVAVKEYTKAKKDDQAAAVEKELESFRKGTEVAPWVARFPPGMYNEAADDGSKATIDLRRDGTFIRLREDKKYVGTVSFVDGKLVLKCLEFAGVWTNAGTEIKAEYWWPANRYPKFKSQGKGTIVRSKN